MHVWVLKRIILLARCAHSAGVLFSPVRAVQVSSISQSQCQGPTSLWTIEQLRMGHPTRSHSRPEFGRNRFMSNNLLKTHGTNLHLKRGVDGGIYPASRGTDSTGKNTVVHVQKVSNAQTAFHRFVQLRAEFCIECPPIGGAFWKH